MAPTLYYLLGSAPCRSVLLTADALGVKLELKTLDLLKGEHKTPEFLKINPQHTIPTLVDDGFVLWESRAICAYLVNKYGKTDDPLYPRDPQKRATVDRLLYFDIGSLYKAMFDFYVPQWFRKEPADPEKEQKLKDTLATLDQMLEGKTYLTGDSITIADLSIITIVSNLQVLEFSLEAYPNVSKWAKAVADNAVGYEESNGKGATMFAAFIKSRQEAS